MISMELSTVQHNTAKSAELDAAVASYLAQGGAICTLQGFAYKPKPTPKPYSRLSLGDRRKAAPHPAPKRVLESKQAERAARQEELKKARAQQFERIRELAKTMTITQVLHEVGLSNKRLRAIAAEVGFEFQKYDPTPTLKPNRVNRKADPANVARIITARDRGLSRKAAQDELGISQTLMRRLLVEYGIYYPVQRLAR